MGLDFQRPLRALAELAGFKTGAEAPAQPLGKLAKVPPSQGKGDQLAHLLATSIPVQKLQQKGIETPLRSFHLGELVAVNLAQNSTVYYVDSTDPEAPWVVSSPSPQNTVVKGGHLENVGRWVQTLDPQIVEYLRLASAKRGILIEHLSPIGNTSGRGQAIQEYSAFHDILKARPGGFDTTDADQLKIAVGPNRKDVKPHPVRFLKNSTHRAEAICAGENGDLAAPPSLLMNLSFDTFYYVSIHGDKIRDVAIDRFVTDEHRALENYQLRIRDLLLHFFTVESELHQRFKRVAEAQGAVIVALPLEKELRDEAMLALKLALSGSKIDHSKVRGVFFYLKHDFR